MVANFNTFGSVMELRVLCNCDCGLVVDVKGGWAADVNAKVSE